MRLRYIPKRLRGDFILNYTDLGIFLKRHCSLWSIERHNADSWFRAVHEAHFVKREVGHRYEELKSQGDKFPNLFHSRLELDPCGCEQRGYSDQQSHGTSRTSIKVPPIRRKRNRCSSHQGRAALRGG